MFPGPPRTDADRRALVKAPDALPAREWADRCEAADVSWGLFEYDGDETRAVIDRLFALGAVEVWAVRFDDEDRESTNELVVERPDDPAARRALREWDRERLAEMAPVPGPDDGGRLM